MHLKKVMRGSSLMSSLLLWISYHPQHETYVILSDDSLTSIITESILTFYQCGKTKVAPSIKRVQLYYYIDAMKEFC